jgi:hypothetical protein
MVKISKKYINLNNIYEYYKNCADYNKNVFNACCIEYNKYVMKYFENGYILLVGHQTMEESFHYMKISIQLALNVYNNNQNGKYNKKIAIYNDEECEIVEKFEFNDTNLKNNYHKDNYHHFQKIKNVSKETLNPKILESIKSMNTIFLEDVLD